MIFAMVEASGEVIGVVTASADGLYEDGGVYGEHTAIAVATELLTPDEQLAFGETHYWSFNDGAFKQRPPKPSEFHDWAQGAWVFNAQRKAAWLSQTINPIRDRLEEGRVTVDGHLIDIDERAEKRMTDALKLWDDLGVATIPWVLGDNTEFPVDKAQLQRFYDEGVRLRALRALQLHAESRALKDNLDTTEADIQAWVATYQPG